MPLPNVKYVYQARGIPMDINLDLGHSDIFKAWEQDRQLIFPEAFLILNKMQSHKPQGSGQGLVTPKVLVIPLKQCLSQFPTVFTAVENTIL